MVFRASPHSLVFGSFGVLEFRRIERFGVMITPIQRYRTPYIVHASSQCEGIGLFAYAKQFLQVESRNISQQALLWSNTDIGGSLYRGIPI